MSKFSVQGSCFIRSFNFALSVCGLVAGDSMEEKVGILGGAMMIRTTDGSIIKIEAGFVHLELPDQSVSTVDVHDVLD